MCFLSSLLKDIEAEDVERVMQIKCSVQSGVFQGGVVSDTLYFFLMYTS